MLETIGKYKIIDKIGSGAMGVVYKGFDPKMGRYVAVKMMSPHFVDNEDNRARFYKEAIAPAKLFHRNIVAIYDLDEEDGVPFIVMEFLDGLDLKYFRTAKISFSIPQILNILIQISDGLDYAHNRGIIHRDVKPANIILQKSGFIKILDFGIARLMESAQQTRTGVTMGTPAYMSPEQARALKVDPRADQYSVGVIGYELITGKNPFDCDNYASSLSKVLKYQPPPVAEVESQCPEYLSAAIMRAILKEREERFPDLKAFAQVCHRVLDRYEAVESVIDFSRLGLDRTDAATLQEPYKIRLVRRYIKEAQFEAAQRLLQKLRLEEVDQGLVDSLQTELDTQCTQKRIADLMKLGRDLVEKDDLDLALTNFNEVLELNSNHVDALTWVQKVQLLKKEKLHREQIQPLMEETARNSSSGDFLAAIESSRKVLSLDPDCADAQAAIAENERRLARASQIRRLTEDIQTARSSLDFPAAFDKLSELETLEPASPDTMAQQAAVFQSFLSEVANRLQAPPGPDGPPWLRDWLAPALGQRSVNAFFTAPGHAAETGELLQTMRQTAAGWLQGGQTEPAATLVNVLRPLFPREASLQALADDVERVQQSSRGRQQRQLARQRQLTEGIQKVRADLQADNPASAGQHCAELAALFPDEPALSPLREEIQATAIRLEALQALPAHLEQVRDLLQSDRLDEARDLLGTLDARHPQHPGLRSCRSILEEKERRQADQAEIQRLGTEIRRHQAGGRLDQALEAARAAIGKFPLEPDFVAIFGQIQQERDAEVKQQDILQNSQEIQRLLEQRQFLKAGKAAYELKNRFPEDPAAAEILKSFQERRADYIQQTIAAARAVRGEADFPAAHAALEQAAAECPDSVDLQNALHELVIAEAMQQGLDEAREFLSNRRFDLALATLEGLLARYPEETNIVGFYTEVREQRADFIREIIRRANQSADAGELEPAASLLRAAQEIVPNSAEVQELLEAMHQRKETAARQQMEAAEETRLLEAELEIAQREARRFQEQGNLFDALRVLEETRQHFPTAGPRLEQPIRRIQQLIDLEIRPAGATIRVEPPGSEDSTAVSSPGPAAEPAIPAGPPVPAVPATGPLPPLPGAAATAAVKSRRRPSPWLILFGVPAALALVALTIVLGFRLFPPPARPKTTIEVKQPVKPAPTPVAVDFTIWFEIQNQPAPVSDRHVFTVQEPFKLVLTADRAGYIYIIWHLPEGLHYLFPNPWANQGLARIEANRPYRLPAEGPGEWVRFLAEPGIDELSIIYAARPEPLRLLESAYVAARTDPALKLTPDGAYKILSFIAAIDTIGQRRAASPAGEVPTRSSFRVIFPSEAPAPALIKVVLQHQ